MTNQSLVELINAQPDHTAQRSEPKIRKFSSRSKDRYRPDGTLMGKKSWKSATWLIQTDDAIYLARKVGPTWTLSLPQCHPLFDPTWGLLVTPDLPTLTSAVELAASLTLTQALELVEEHLLNNVMNEDKVIIDPDTGQEIIRTPFKPDPEIFRKVFAAELALKQCKTKWEQMQTLRKYFSGVS